MAIIRCDCCMEQLEINSTTQVRHVNGMVICLDCYADVKEMLDNPDEETQPVFEEEIGEKNVTNLG